jgi:hypothetical protein
LRPQRATLRLPRAVARPLEKTREMLELVLLVLIELLVLLVLLVLLCCCCGIVQYTY